MLNNIDRRRHIPTWRRVPQTVIGTVSGGILLTLTFMLFFSEKLSFDLMTSCVIGGFSAVGTVIALLITFEGFRGKELF